MGLGLANWREGNLDGVRTNFERVVMIEPDHPTALAYLERLAGASVATRRAPDAADQACMDGNTELAFELYSARLETGATDSVALLRAGLIHAWSERYVAALQLLDLLVDLEPNNVEGRLARARVYAWSGDTPLAVDQVERILEVQPDHAEAPAALSLFQSWSGQADEAGEACGELISIAPGYRAGQQQRIQALARATQYDQSLSTFQALVEENPDDIDVRLGLARALGFAGDYAGAVDQYDEVLLRSPEEMRALAGRSKIFGWAGQLVDSERAALRAFQVDSGNGEAWASLGEALDAFEVAAGLAPANPEIRDQLRSAQRSVAPRARPTFTWARDSDGNRMLTTSATASVYVTSTLQVRGSGYQRTLEQVFAVDRLEKRAFGGMVDADLQVRPGWQLNAGVGGSVTDGVGDPSFLAVRAGMRSPEQYAVVASVNLSSYGLDETASLAERGVRATDVVLSLRWNPAPLWRVDVALGQGRYDGTQANGRRSGYLGASRRIGRFYSLGVSVRGFSFEKNLSDGYFDPDFYGVAEVTGYWLYRPAPWSFLVEAALGVQQIGSDGERAASLRGNGRVGYRLGSGRELSVSYSYSTAGLTASATGSGDCDYSALTFGFNWTF